MSATDGFGDAMTEYFSLDEIEPFPRAHYEVDIPWSRIEKSLVEFGSGCDMQLNPDFQRAHVWTEDQQRAYVEYVLRGGEVGKNITWNCKGWPRVRQGEPLTLVDGKQRLEAVRKFVRGDLAVFGGKVVNPDARLPHYIASLRFRVCSLDRRGVLRLYLAINAGGTPHTSDELDRVRDLLAVEAET